MGEAQQWVGVAWDSQTGTYPSQPVRLVVPMLARDVPSQTRLRVELPGPFPTEDAAWDACREYVAARPGYAMGWGSFRQATALLAGARPSEVEAPLAGPDDTHDGRITADRGRRP